ncbi:MAG: undecaprenyl-diphosphatase UppP [Oligoflexia bacterium]|nr:undecaprenyl-diphosphatase UppP [Oligoflexia bacterium]
MTILQSIILGIVQGLGEFLPISSSAHLIIVPWLMGWPDHGLTFDIALHFGTLTALLIYFHREWYELSLACLRLRPKHFKPGALNNDTNLRLALYIVIATIPGAILGLLLEHHVETVFRNPKLIAFTLSGMGIALWIVDKKAPKSRDIVSLTLKDAVIIGISQGLALFPGISRSGITITTGLLRGLDRGAAARFSFMLSMPITAGACILKLRHLTAADFTNSFIVGVIVAAIFGYLAIGGLIRFLQTRSYGVFAVYRVVLALIIGVVIFYRG